MKQTPLNLHIVTEIDAGEVLAYMITDEPHKHII